MKFINTKNLYLVNVDAYGCNFWKLGLTNFEDPIKLDKSHYLECYRKVRLPEKAAKEVLNAITINIDNLISICENEGFKLAKPKNGFSYDLPLVVIEDIFDFWVNIHADPLCWAKCIGLLNFRKQCVLLNNSFQGAFLGDTAIWSSKINSLHSYRPFSIREAINADPPMW